MTPSSLLSEIQAAAAIVHALLPPTPVISWPLLNQRAGREVWVKHENHQPIGSFKLRGGLVYLDKLRKAFPEVPGIISATRGNHGQSLAFAAGRHGLPCTIVVPEGNNPEKNAAIRALGAELIEIGEDFQEAAEHAGLIAQERGLHMIPAFHPWLVQGVASYGLELFSALPNLDSVYVPIGMGSGICATIAVRDALGLSTRIIGVAAESAPAYADSYWAGRVMTTPTANTIADGLACRVPDPTAVGIIAEGVEKVVTVSDDEILDAMGHYFTDSHNLAEGAAAAPLAALLTDPEAGQKVGLILTGGNADAALFRQVLERMGV